MSKARASGKMDIVSMLQQRVEQELKTNADTESITIPRVMAVEVLNEMRARQPNWNLGPLSSSLASKQQQHRGERITRESVSTELDNQEANERLKMVLKASSAGILTIDLDTRDIYLDEFSCSLLELDSHQCNGTIASVLRRIHPQDRSRVNQGLRKAIAGNKPLDLEFRTRPLDVPERFISVKGHKIVSAGRCFFAGLLMDHTQQRKLELEAEALRVNQQKMIMDAAIKAQEKERAALSQFLHDSICQLLYGIKLNLQSMQFANVYKGPFQNINELLDRVIKETREISYELTPSVYRDFGFMAGIKEMFQRLSTRTFAINLNANEEMDALDSKIQLYLFRILQELINNCIKHADASTVDVELSISSGQVHVWVKDDGHGFSKPMERAELEGSGIRGIRNRMFLLNGTIRFFSSPRGTKVHIVFPAAQRLSGLN